MPYANNAPKECFIHLTRLKFGSENTPHGKSPHPCAMYIYSSFFAFKDRLVCYFLGLIRRKVVFILLDAYKFKFVPLHVSINNEQKNKKKNILHNDTNFNIPTVATDVNNL